MKKIYALYKGETLIADGTKQEIAEQMGVKPSTVSKWCTNSSQPDVASLLRIADLLEVDIKELIVREYKAYIEKANSTIGLY